VSEKCEENAGLMCFLTEDRILVQLKTLIEGSDHGCSVNVLFA